MGTAFWIVKLWALPIGSSQLHLLSKHRASVEFSSSCCFRQRPLELWIFVMFSAIFRFWGGTLPSRPRYSFINAPYYPQKPVPKRNLLSGISPIFKILAAFHIIGFVQRSPSPLRWAVFSTFRDSWIENLFAKSGQMRSFYVILFNFDPLSADGAIIAESRPIVALGQQA